MSDGIEDDGSDAARIGTACHQICEEVLIDSTIDCQSYLGRKMWWEGHDGYWSEHWPHTDVSPEHEVVVTQEMIDAVVTSLNFVNNIHATKGGMLEAEQKVPIGFITGEEGATGTSDVIIVGDGWLWCGDFKFGRGKVTAYDILTPAHRDIITQEMVPEVVRANLQLALYLLGAAHKYELLGPFHTVTICVVQPFLNHVSEYTCSMDELQKLAAWLSQKAEETRTKPVFVPSFDNCHFCKAKGPNCKAQTEFVMQHALLGFDDVSEAKPRPVKDIELGDMYALVPMLADWSKAVAERVEQKLASGEPVVRSDGLFYKHVQGKKGDREWVDPAQAEEALKRMRLKPEQIYKTSLQTPTQIEKLSKAPKVKKGEEPIKPVLGPTQWNRISALIRQSDGKPVIALSTDPRPAVASRTDGFGDVPPSDNSDLF